MKDVNGYMPMPGDILQMYSDHYEVVRNFDVPGTLMAVFIEVKKVKIKEDEVVVFPIEVTKIPYPSYTRLLKEWDRCFEILDMKKNRRKIVEGEEQFQK